MPSYEDELSTRTHKGQCETVHQRVLYTLGESLSGPLRDLTPMETRVWLHKTTMALALLMEHLSESGHLPEAKLDDILYRSTS